MANTDEIVIDLGTIIALIRRSIHLIVGVAIACTVLTYIVCAAFVEPTYKATASVYVHDANARDEITNSANISTVEKLLNSVVFVIKSANVVDKVIDLLGLDYSTKELQSMISASVETGTSVIYISTSSIDPTEASNITNTLIKVAQPIVMDIIKNGELVPIDNAGIPTTPVSTSPLISALIGGFLGVVALIAVMFIMMVMDKKVHTESDLAIDDIPVLGIIPTITD